MHHLLFFPHTHKKRKKRNSVSHAKSYSLYYKEDKNPPHAHCTLHSLLMSSLFMILCFLSVCFVITMAIDGDDKPMIDTHENVLQKHAAFFDRNHDGVIYPWETFQGFRAIGAGLALSTVASVFINMGLSGKTRPGKSPNPLFPIEVKNIAKSKHGSDTGAYDTEGRFVPAKFEEIFQKHAHTNPNALTSDELSEMLKANQVPKDFPGWLASSVEWKVLYLLAKDKNGLLQKDTVRAVFDGSLFQQMEKGKSSEH